MHFPQTIILTLAAVSCCCGVVEGVREEIELKRRLLADYDKTQRPVLSYDSTVVVNVQIYVVELLSVVGTFRGL